MLDVIDRAGMSAYRLNPPKLKRGSVLALLEAACTQVFGTKARITYCNEGGQTVYYLVTDNLPEMQEREEFATIIQTTAHQQSSS